MVNTESLLIITECVHGYFYVQKTTLCAIYAAEYLILNYIDVTNHNHIQSWTVTDTMTR